jgi:signal transduction histidine kinase
MKRILAIDGESNHRRAVAAVLWDYGFGTLEASDGMERLSLARAKGRDLIMSDVNMEGMDGIRLLQLLRSNSAMAATPVILMTDALESSGMRQSMELGADDYLFEQFPAAIQETQEGVGRIAKIMHAMKEFSHPSSAEKCPADLNEAFETTVTVARDEWKHVANVILEFDPHQPPLPCFLDEFNEVIPNLVFNASHAIGDANKSRPDDKGTIWINARVDGEHVENRVSDLGTGIRKAARRGILEAFFTTKPDGKGTGQGRATVYGSVVKKHGGTVTFETEVGTRTTFIERLPLTARLGGALAGSAAPRPA